MPLYFRLASVEDGPLLAELNAVLIEDEGHRNPMTDAALRQRMEGWLRGEYQTALFETDTREIAGYALYQRHPDDVYLRQFLVARSFRRKGIGRAALTWLWNNPWNGVPRCRVEVLSKNGPAIAFWQAVGFRDYAITLEMNRPSMS